MNNDKTLNFFKDLSEKEHQAGIEKYGQDNSKIDAEFILKYVGSETILLDIGSGSGLILNKIEPYVRHITAVEPFKGFTKHIKKSDKIRILNLNVFDLETNQLFDFITLFGFMHYLNKNEGEIVYRRCLTWLKPSGKLIIKNQFGISTNVIVDGYSTELKRNYSANYRQLDNEIALLSSLGYVNIRSFDIYPHEANRWENTHFYAVIAKKPAEMVVCDC